MLLRFAVENHRSIMGKQELSLVASSLDDATAGLIPNPADTTLPLLPALVIYGANASGKSTLLSAIEFMRSAIVSSHSAGGPGSGVPISPFLLDPRSATSPSKFEADFLLGETRYHYGFEASKEAFLAEWLFSYPHGRRQSLFHREDGAFSFGRALKGQNKVISNLTRPNSLFLSAAAQNGHELLSKVSAFFTSIRIETAPEDPTRVGISSRADIDPRVIEFLRHVGTGVVDYRREERKESEDTKQFQKDLDQLIRKHLGDAFVVPSHEDEVRFEIRLAHRGSGDDLVYLDLREESAGTRRLLSLLSWAFRALDDGTIVLSDEFDASLHTRACERLLTLFCTRSINPKGAQLIATTHDTNLLGTQVLRRDQVWFTEKDAAGATHVYPLTDIRTRKGDNIERGYFQGRYGAVPMPPPIVEPTYGK